MDKNYYSVNTNQELQLSEICSQTGLRADADPQILRELGFFPIEDVEPLYEIISNPPYGFEVREGIAFRKIVNMVMNLDEVKNRASVLVERLFMEDIYNLLGRNPKILADCVLFSIYGLDGSFSNYCEIRDMVSAHKKILTGIEDCHSSFEILTVLRENGFASFSS